jgi:hypothetical protein
MRAEISISHNTGDLAGAVEALLGPHDPSALAQSVSLANARESRAQVTYARLTPQYRLLCWPDPPSDFQAFVEPVDHSDLRRACEKVWSQIRAGGKKMKPRLESMEIVDSSGRVVLEGKTGFGASLGRSETIAVGITGLATLALLLSGWLTFADDDRMSILLGSASALIAAIVVGLSALLDVKRRRIVWT